VCTIRPEPARTECLKHPSKICWWHYNFSMWQTLMPYSEQCDLVIKCLKIFVLWHYFFLEATDLKVSASRLRTKVVAYVFAPNWGCQDFPVQNKTLSSYYCHNFSLKQVKVKLDNFVSEKLSSCDLLLFVVFRCVFLFWSVFRHSFLSPLLT